MTGEIRRLASPVVGYHPILWYDKNAVTDRAVFPEGFVVSLWISPDGDSSTNSAVFVDQRTFDQRTFPDADRWDR